MSTTSQQPGKPSVERVWHVPLDLRERLLDALTGEPAQIVSGTMTYEEFLDWLDEDTLAEWVDGKVVVTSPASLDHQEIADFLVAVLRNYVSARQLGRALSAPFQMKLEQTGREPDLLFIASEHYDRLKPTFLDGPADLVIEILSPESIGRDRGEKFFEYERAGIPEYWLIDPLTRRAEFYQLDEQRRYQPVIVGGDGIYRSRVIAGFWLRPSWLWQRPLPDVEDVLLDVGGQEYADDLIARLRRRGLLPGE